MTVLANLLLSLNNLLSFYAYPIGCFDISPIAGVWAAGCFLLGAAVHSFLLWRRKRAAWFPDLCAVWGCGAVSAGLPVGRAGQGD